jgi:hypothetical protein
MNNQATAPTKEREYLHTLSAGALLPFAQASGFAFVIFVAVYVIGEIALNLIDPHKPAVFIGVMAWVWMLYRLLRHWLRLTMPEIVTVIKDISDDGRLNNSVQAEAEEEPSYIRIQLVKENGHVADMINLPGDEHKLAALAQGLLNGMPFSEKMWTPEKAGKPFSTNTFRALKDVMLKRGLCEYSNPNEPRQGIRLTEEGRQVMQHLARPHSPTEEEA